MSSKIDLKVVLLGKAFAGKTSLVERFIHDRFSGDAVPYQNTIGAAFGAKKVEVGNRSVIMGIWDTAGSERYEAMSRIYYRGAKAAIVCYDLTERSSFDRAKFWINELKQNEENCKIYLAGTKQDLLAEKSNRDVDYHTTTDYGEDLTAIIRDYFEAEFYSRMPFLTPTQIGAEVYETSSKTGHNIKELFIRIAMDFLNNPSPQLSNSDEHNTVPVNSRSALSSKSKCVCEV